MSAAFSILSQTDSFLWRGTAWAVCGLHGFQPASETAICEPFLIQSEGPAAYGLMKLHCSLRRPVANLLVRALFPVFRFVRQNLAQAEKVMFSSFVFRAEGQLYPWGLVRVAAVGAAFANAQVARTDRNG